MASLIDVNGSLRNSGCTNKTISIRPALWVDIELMFSNNTNDQTLYSRSQSASISNLEWHMDLNTVRSAISAMEKNIDKTVLKMPDGKLSDFDQKIEYDEESNTFNHFVFYPAFFTPGYALTLDLDPSTVPSWERLWEISRQTAELWLTNDALDASDIPNATIVLSFVSTLDTASEKYLEIYTLKMQNYQAKVITNILTDDFTPVITPELEYETPNVLDTNNQSEESVDDKKPDIEQISGHEKFIFPNGIKFEDSEGIVLKKESIPLEKEKTKSERYKGAKYRGRGTFENDDLSLITYYFDKGGKLQEVIYDVHAGMKDPPYGFLKKTDAEASYNLIKNSLTEQYGSPLQKKDSIHVAKETSDLANLDKFIVNKPIYSSEWLVSNGDHYVKIELYLCNSVDLYKNKPFRVICGYAYIP